MQPLVSILFPCYNAEKYLSYSLESMLNQEYRQLEVICINDGSTDGTLQLLKSYQEKDKRVVIVDNPQNLGLIGSLNKSLSYISGEYFARMDADDFSLPQRIALQVEFLLKHPQYDIISSAYNYFREDGSVQEYVAPVGTLPNALKFISLFSTPLAHGSVCGKTSLIKSGLYYYDKNYPHAEDFELFSRLCWQDVRMTSIRQPLYRARLNEGSVSAVYTNAQMRTNHNILWRNLRDYLGIRGHLAEASLKAMSSRIDKPITLKELKAGHALLNEFYMLAQSKLPFSEAEKKEVKRYLKLQLLNSIIQANKAMFRESGTAGLRFLAASLFLVRPGQLGLLFRKLGKVLFYSK